MSGVLFFDGACGMCTRSRDLLLRLNRTGGLATEPLQSPGTAERLGFTPDRLMESIWWLDSSGTVYGGAEAAKATGSRSVAFTKGAWRRAGGYPEWLDYCEDVVFDLKLRQKFGPFLFVPEAVVHFRPRGGKTPCIAMQKFRVRYGCMLLCGWLPPTFATVPASIGVSASAGR